MDLAADTQDCLKIDEGGTTTNTKKHEGHNLLIINFNFVVSFVRIYCSSCYLLLLTNLFELLNHLPWF